MSELNRETQELHNRIRKEIEAFIALRGVEVLIVNASYVKGHLMLRADAYDPSQVEKVSAG